MLIRRFGLALAVSSGLILAGSARAADSTDYFGADKSGDLVRVTVTGNHAGATAVVRQGNPETQQTSLAGSDGGVIVGLVADSNAGTTKLFTYDTATQHFTDLSSLGSHIAAATIYDGGARIAYSRALKHRYVIRSAPATGGPTTTLFSSKAWKPWDVAVSESGRRVYFSATETWHSRANPAPTRNAATSSGSLPPARRSSSGPSRSRSVTPRSSCPPAVESWLWCGNA